MSEQNMPERDPDYVCEDYGDVKAWTQIRVTVPLEQLDSFKEKTEAVLGQGRCHTVMIRPAGGVRLG